MLPGNYLLFKLICDQISIPFNDLQRLFINRTHANLYCHKRRICRTEAKFPNLKHFASENHSNDLMDEKISGVHGFVLYA